VDPTPADPRDDWQLSETHLAVSPTLAGIPQRNGNPVPGQFPLKGKYNPPRSDTDPPVTYTLPLPAATGTLYVAAHGVAKVLGGLEGLAYALPSTTVTVRVSNPYSGAEAYFPSVTVSNGSFVTGVYEGWCIDVDHPIGGNTNYTAKLYSSYEPLPAGLLEHPENLDLINWIVNQDFVGKPAIDPLTSTSLGTFTYGDVQRAIWALIDDNQSTAGLGTWSQARVSVITAAALANGEGFVPSYTQYVVIIIVPNPTGVIQVITAGNATLQRLGIPAQTRQETIWAGAKRSTAGWDFPFSGRNWATYVKYPL